MTTTSILTDEQILSALLNTYQKPLHQKHIFDTNSLATLIKIDVNNIAFALQEMRERTVASLMTQFLKNCPECLDNVLNKLTMKRLYHVGLESNLPLELSLYLFKYSIGSLNSDIPRDFNINRSLMFPASSAFQHRVQAFTEIMRIWLQHQDGSKPMLELFDIHQPLNLEQLLANQQQGIRDNTWHYAVYINDKETVENFHHYFYELSHHYPEYTLPFPEIIHNQNDGSVLTKVINTAQNIEVEFVTGSFVTGPIPKPTKITTASAEV